MTDNGAPIFRFDPADLDPTDLHMILIGARAAVAVDAFWKASTEFVAGVDDTAGIRLCDDAAGWALATAEQAMSVEPGTLSGFVAVFANRPFDPFLWVDDTRERTFDPVDAPAEIRDAACRIVDDIVATSFDSWALFPSFLDVGPAFNDWVLGGDR